MAGPSVAGGGEWLSHINRENKADADSAADLCHENSAPVFLCSPPSRSDGNRLRISFDGSCGKEGAPCSAGVCVAYAGINEKVWSKCSMFAFPLPHANDSTEAECLALWYAINIIQFFLNHHVLPTFPDSIPSDPLANPSPIGDPILSSQPKRRRFRSGELSGSLGIG